MLKIQELHYKIFSNGKVILNLNDISKYYCFYCTAQETYFNFFFFYLIALILLNGRINRDV